MIMYSFMNPEKLQAIADVNFIPNNDVSDKLFPSQTINSYQPLF